MENTYEKFLRSFESMSGFSAETFRNLTEDTSEHVALRILNQFRITLETSVIKLAIHLESKNWEDAEKICHRVAGSSELIGFKGLGKRCREIMNMVRQKTGDIEAAVTDVRAHCKELHEALLLHCPNLSSFL